MRNTTISILAAGLAAAAFLAGCEPEKSAPAKQATVQPPSQIDPQAQAVLKSMSEYLDASKSFTCTVFQMYDTTSPSGQLVQLTRKSEVSVVRSDRLAVVTQGYNFEKKFWYDGKKLTVLNVTDKVYATDTQCPDDISKMLDFLAAKYNIVMPLADVMFPQSYKAMLENVTTGQYLGVHRCGKHKCHHLAFEQPNIDWQVWIDTGSKPLLRKIMVIYKNEPGMPRYTSVIRDWDMGPKISKDAFEAQVPSEANLVTLDKMFNTKKGK